jgi:hypothetical protein
MEMGEVTCCGSDPIIVDRIVSCRLAGR